MGEAADRLLAAQSKEQQKQTTPASEHSDVLKAEEAAKIAKSQLEQATADTKRKVLEQGYQTLEEGLADIEKRRKEVDELLKAARQEQLAIGKEREAFEEQKAKLTNALQVLKQKDALINSKFEQSLKIQESQEANKNNYHALREELIELVVFHKLNIIPCRKTLLNVSRAIYGWFDVLQQSRTDFTGLYNYIGQVMRVIDCYIETTDTKSKQTPVQEPEEDKEGSWLK